MDPFSTFAAAKLGVRLGRELRDKIRDGDGPKTSDGGTSPRQGEIVEDLVPTDDGTYSVVTVPHGLTHVRGFVVIKDNAGTDASPLERTWRFDSDSGGTLTIKYAHGGSHSASTVTVWVM